MKALLREPPTIRLEGYIWIWGGPYDTREEIEGYFHEYAQESAIYASGSIGLVEGAEEHG
jgi:hypothetical protein